MRRIPTFGLFDTADLVEAAAGSFQEIMELIEVTLRDRLKMSGDDEVWPWVRALFPSNVVVSVDGKLWSYPYSVSDDKTVVLGNPVEVEENFQPVKTGDAAPGAFVEALDKKGGARWRICAIRGGVSGNRNIYPDAVLREAVPLFDGARVLVRSDEDHIAQRGNDLRNLIGRLVEPVFVEGKGTSPGEVQAVLEMIEPEGEIAVKLREAWDRGMTGLFGFSISAKAKARRLTRNGQKFVEAIKFTAVKSVDLIIEPGAGGELINLIEAKQEGTIMDRDEIIALIEAKRPDLLKDRQVEELTDDELKLILTEAIKEPEAPAKPEGAAKTEEAPTGVTQQQVDEQVRMVEARALMRVAVDASSLPDTAKARMKQRFAETASFTEAQITDAIKDEADYLAEFTESGTVRGLGDIGRIETGETRHDKIMSMLDAFFDPAHKDHRHARSFKECYIEITGDRKVTGRLDDADQVLLREALASTDFASVLGDSITRRMVADYNTPNQYDVWRRVATITQISDFRTQERTRFGGYGDLPIVAEAANYLPVTSPTDEKATYAAAKRGGTEAVTLEMIKNDDAGAIRRIPMKFSRAARRTLAKFVLDFIRTNPVIYDALALFVTGHNNLAVTALDGTSLAAARLAMLKQAELDTGEQLDIGPKSLLVPPDLEETAVDLFRRNTENDKTFVQSMVLDILVVWYWTDANDWALVADPNDIPTIEVGFLDGDEEPALFVQDNPTVGSMFTSDQLTWKLRHIYGAAVMDFRGFHKNVVV